MILLASYNWDNSGILLIKKVFDKEKDGFIEEECVRHVLANLGENITDEEIREIIDETEKDDRGRINIKELMSVLTH